MPLPPIIGPRAAQPSDVVGEILGALAKGLYDWAEKLFWKTLGVGYGILIYTYLGLEEWKLTHLGNLNETWKMK